ncbi:hypothetical protein V1477_001783 [Vespula maculifrons]|uniref:Uncharacterized protein n=1 Tax=Vespula maculifrons TaxID=7453 RepID=A0ABD2CX35_VESMC
MEMEWEGKNREGWTREHDDAPSAKKCRKLESKEEEEEEEEDEGEVGGEEEDEVSTEDLVLVSTARRVHCLREKQGEKEEKENEKQ